MITLQDVKQNEEVNELVMRSTETIRRIRIYRTLYKAHKYCVGKGRKNIKRFRV